MKPIKLKITLDTSDLKSAEAEGKKVGDSFAKGFASSKAASERLTQIQLDGLRKIDAARQKTDASNIVRQTGAERREHLHQQRLELIHQRSAARLAEIETRKQAQIEGIRQRAFEREQQRLRKLETQQPQSTRAGIGSALTGIGLATSVAGAGVAYSAFNRGFELDAARTQLTAILGTVDAANQKISQLRALAKESVGLTQQAATESFAIFKLAGNLADMSIDKVIKSIGRLNAAFKIDSIQLFSRNLLQIFNNFDKQDIREALDRIPIFNQLLASAFGTSDPEKLRKLKAAGKLTLESYLTGLADAINQDSRLKNIQDSLQTKLAKSLDETNARLAQMGEKVLRDLLPILDKLLPPLNSILDIFSKMPGWLQAGVVGFAALGTPIINAATAIGRLTTAITGLNAASAAGGLARIAGFFGTPLGAGLGVAGLGAAGVGLSLYEADRRLKNQQAIFDNQLEQAEYKRKWGFGMPVDPAERARKEAEVMRLNNALESVTGFTGKVNISVSASPLAAGKPLLDLSGAKKAGSRDRIGGGSITPKVDQRAREIAEMKGKIEESRQQIWDDSLADLDKLNDSLRSAITDDETKRKADKAFRATKLIEGRAERQRLTREADERAIEAMQRSAQRTYRRSGDFIENAINRGQLTTGEAEILNQASARDYANRLREVLDAKSKIVGVDQSYLDDLRDEINYYDRLGTSIDNASRFMKGFNSQIQTVGDAFERFGANVSQALTNVKDLFGSLKQAVLQFFNDLLGRSLQNLLRQALNPLIGRLGGLFGNPAAATAGGNMFGGAIGGIPAVAFGGLGGGAFRGSVFNQPSATGIFANGQFAAGLAAQSRGVTGIFADGRFAAGLAGGGVRPQIPAFSLSNVGKSFAAAAPFLGLSIGSALGGQSIAGQILGGAGGLAIGGFGAASLGLLGGKAAALFSNPITAIAGAALLVGGIFLGRAKQRKADEKLADTYWVQYADVLDRLTRDVRANRIDGDDALVQAFAARQQAIDQINTIKTKSVRESRLKNQIGDVDRLKLEPLKQAVADQKRRKEFDSNLIPEFATGGRVPGMPNEKRLVLAHGGELIANARQQTPDLLMAAARAGIPGIGGNNNASANAAPIVEVNYIIGTQEQSEIVINGIRHSKGSKALRAEINNMARYRELA